MLLEISCEADLKDGHGENKKSTDCENVEIEFFGASGVGYINFDADSLYRIKDVCRLNPGDSFSGGASNHSKLFSN